MTDWIDELTEQTDWIDELTEQISRFDRWYYYSYHDYAEGPVCVYGITSWPSWSFWIVPQ